MKRSGKITNLGGVKEQGSSEARHRRPDTAGRTRKVPFLGGGAEVRRVAVKGGGHLAILRNGLVETKESKVAAGDIVPVPGAQFEETLASAMRSAIFRAWSRCSYACVRSLSRAAAIARTRWKAGQDRNEPCGSAWHDSESTDGETP
jgi:hypothetical protein